MCPRDTPGKGPPGDDPDPGAKEAMKDQHLRKRNGAEHRLKGGSRSFKNEFLGRPMRAEGFANRNLQVAWGVLTHDLWVIAEKLREQRKIREQKLRQAA